MNIDFICGVVPPLVTPVDSEDRLDEKAFRKVIEHVVAGGVHGIFVLGTTGEFYGVQFEDKRRALAVALDQVRGRVPVYAGASAIATRECVTLARLAEEEGAQAVTVLTPMFISPSEEELYRHFETIALSTSLPVLLYNNPDRTGINMAAGLIERLANVPNIVGVKNSSGDFTLTAEYIRQTRGKKDFRVMAGRDTLILATLVYGGHGCVAASANVAPALVVEIYEKFRQGDLTGALEAQYRLAPFRMAFNLGSFPVVIKDALNLLGVPAGDPIRPIGHCTEPNLVKLKAILEEMGVM